MYGFLPLFVFWSVSSKSKHAILLESLFGHDWSIRTSNESCLVSHFGPELEPEPDALPLFTPLLLPDANVDVF